MSNTLDPRRGRPSASAMYRLENCPGSWSATKDMPEDDTPYATKGTDLHSLLENDDTEGETMSDEWVLERALSQRDEIAAEYFGGAEFTAIKELRLAWTNLGGVIELTNETTVDVYFTGQADFLAISGDRGLVVDYKTLYGQHQPAPVNSQLRALVVLAAKKWRLREVRVAKVQPRLGRPSLADYDEASLALARESALGTVWRADNATLDDLNAGEWCKFCKALAGCPKARQAALAPIMQMAKALPPDKEKEALFARAMEITTSELEFRYNLLTLVGKYAAAIKGAMKKRVEAGEMPGWRMRPGQIREKVTDVSKVWSRCESRGVKDTEFTSECTITKKGLEAVLRKTGLKGKALESAMKDVLEGATEAKETAQQIEEVLP